MSQSASFPPPYSPSISPVGPSTGGKAIISLTPPDKLSSLTTRHGVTTPPFSACFSALSGGKTLEALSKEVDINLTENELQSLLEKKSSSLVAALAVVAAAPLPFPSFPEV
jgi:hypothetical protein